MEILLRCIMLLVKCIYSILYPVLILLLPREKINPIPPIKNKLLILPVTQLVHELRERKISSIEITSVYIERVKEVNSIVNAVIEERFKEALTEAQIADELIKNAANEQRLEELFSDKPLIGVPFTVKEACGLKGMSHVVGSLQRIGTKSAKDGDVVLLLRAAGGIPLLVSANPEYCFSIETNTYLNGKCNNPFDIRRTAGGSSGGEGALNGAGATTFGLGSDIAGSIRVPSLFNGVFGHKPTGCLTSVRGHFPGATDPILGVYLQMGPITRFSHDLPLLTKIMAGNEAYKLNLETPVELKHMKIFYSMGFSGFNGFFMSSVAVDIKLSIRKAVQHFQKIGVPVAKANIEGFHNGMETALSAIVRLKDFPYLINRKCKVTVKGAIWEYICSIFGHSDYTKDGLFFEVMRRTNAFMSDKNLMHYAKEPARLKAEIMKLLGDNGVLFFPTFHLSAVHHHSSHAAIFGICYSSIFNIIGLPATHVPMGLDAFGLPIGFQVIAAPFQDKLCFKIAAELEDAFGGWTPPTNHAIEG